MSAPRRIVVDDTDPAIQYGPSGWFVADSTKLNTIGNYGPVYNGTSHAATTDATLSFPFNGTAITVLGTIAITKDANNNTDPTWDCFVDEIQITNPNPTFQFPENNWALCDQAQIASGSHMLTIQVKSKGQPFYLDQIIYRPLPTVQYDGAVLEYTNTDPSVSFGTGWRQWGVQNVTQTTGAQVALNFHGTGVSLFGYVPTELPHNSTSASYTIDGGPPVPFVLNGLAAQSATLYNAVMFTTNTLTPATHNLVVSYGGDSSKTPLVVGAFYVTNTSTPSTSTSTSAAPGNSPSADASTSTVTTKKSSPVGAIIGGIVGCLVTIALVVGLVFWCRRRRRRQTESIRRTSANPFMASAVGTGPASVSGAQYSYASVPAETYGYPYAQPETPGSPEQQPMTTAYPYAPPVPSQPSSDAGAGPSSRSHAHSPSGSSGYVSSSMHDLSARANAVVGSYSMPASYPAPVSYPTPVPSDGSVRSRKHEQEMASASLATPSISGDMPLTPQRRSQQRQIEILRHQDSGVRLNAMPPSPPASEREIVELPPGYSRD